MGLFHAKYINFGHISRIFIPIVLSAIFPMQSGAKEVIWKYFFLKIQYSTTGGRRKFPQINTKFFEHGARSHS